MYFTTIKKLINFKRYFVNTATLKTNFNEFYSITILLSCFSFEYMKNGIFMNYGIYFSYLLAEVLFICVTTFFL